MPLRLNFIAAAPTRLQLPFRRYPVLASRHSCRKWNLVRCHPSDDAAVSSQKLHKLPPSLSKVEEEDRRDRPPKKSPLRVLMEQLRILFSPLKDRILLVVRHPIFRAILFTLSLICIHGLFLQRRGYRINVLYSEFVKQVEAGKVETVYFDSKGNGLRFTYRSEIWNQLRQQLKNQNLSPDRIEKRIGRIQTCSKAVPGQTDSLTQLLKKKNVHYGVAEASVGSYVGSFVSTMFWLWVPLLPLIYVFKGMLNTRLGDKNKKVKKTAMTSVGFRDVAGMDEAKLELLEVVELLKEPEKYAMLNARVPSGVLLCGPTGTGKTLLARAVAGEAGVPFFAVSASEFVEMFVGRGAARIRELFREARKHTPCVVFIDEIDSVGGMRGNSFNEERDQTLNQLLVELDGFEDTKSIVLLAATNRLDTLDPALLRPGRLTRKISIALPDASGRAAILAVHLRDVPMQSLQDKIDACGLIGKLSEGFSGAELANAVNEAALMAARGRRTVVDVQDLLKGLQRTKRPVNASDGWLNAFQSYLVDQTWHQRQRRRLLG